MKADTLTLAQEQKRAPWTDVELETRDFIVYKDAFPVTEGHTLIVPREATQENILKCFNYAVTMGYDNVESKNNNITGYNVGLNVGESAGQTCMYPHVHLIFRRNGDMEDPRGGVRHVIPAKGNYKSTEEANER
ncbi:MAG: HIT family protein [Candidatus Marinimicrobia bacterium]|jgi:ATP adenylyltransferase|nr:HIT family protein [Candidatus Neomarinimicrobiota bacterium]|tara:strand:+ start:2357 stop:2758 length:402 start_codon:yes stop_codon:yes gene_type:complete